jgi:integrase
MIPKGPNRWLLRIFLGRVVGKRRYSSKAFQGTTSQAIKELTSMTRAVDTQTFVEPSKQSLGDYLTVWLLGKIDVTSGTQASYKRQLVHFGRLLGDRPLTSIVPEDVQRVLSVMADKHLSRRTMQYARAVLHAAFQDAMQDNLLIRNPVANTKLPPRVKRAPTILSMQQVNRFLEVTDAAPFHPLWMLLLTTGLRPQEALALKWSDVNLPEQWLSVSRVLQEQGDGTFALTEATKTEASTRRLGLPLSTVEALKAHRTISPLNLVFPGPTGAPLDISRVRRAWKADLKAAKLPIIRLYDTRHTHATALLAAGADIAWVKARLGHSNVSMTIENYAHVMPETHRKMGEMTERMLREAK